MNKYIPTMYKKNIFDINYDKLKKLGIKHLFFDFDNTIIEGERYSAKDKEIELLKSLKKDFNVLIVSNTLKDKKIKPYSEVSTIDYIKNAGKPHKKRLEKILKQRNIKKEEVCMIGDQLLTDILGGNNLGFKTVLVDPIGKDDSKFTIFNRIREKEIYKKLDNQNLLKKGNYYE